MSQPKTAEEWAMEIQSIADRALRVHGPVLIHNKDARTIAALLARLSGQVEAAKRITEEHAADCLYEDPTCLICRIRAALQEPKT